MSYGSVWGSRTTSILWRRKTPPQKTDNLLLIYIDTPKRTEKSMAKEKPHSIRDHLSYRMDNSLSKGTVNIILWLTLLLAIIVLTMAFFVWITGSSPEISLTEQILSFFRRVLKYPQVTENLIFNIAIFILFITGLFISGALISTLTTGLSSKLSELREGRSKVIESGHTVILGWSPHVLPIISELIIANKNQRNPAIVILGNIPKQEMITHITRNKNKFYGTRIICRQGDKKSVTDLEGLSLNSSKSIIINQEDQDLSDIPKTLLAIKQIRRQGTRNLHVTAIIESEEDGELCNIIGGNEVEIIHAKNFLARLEAQTCRQRGLPHVYTELLNFSGDEIYIQEENTLIGINYIDVIKSYHSSAVIGICDRSNKIKLNPPMDSTLEHGDKVIAISEDDDTIILAEDKNFEEFGGIINNNYRDERKTERFLVLGLNDQTPIMLENLDQYVPSGSSVTVISDQGRLDENFGKKFVNLEIEVKLENFRDRKFLDSISYQDFDGVIIEGNDKVGVDKADTMTLAILVHLRDIREGSDSNFPIVIELFDGKNYELIDSDRSDDFILSDNVLSAVVAQVSEDKLLGEVFRELFRPDGSEIYLKPAGDYVQFDQTINFFTLIDSAGQKGETAIGYRVDEFANTPSRLVGSKEMTYGVIINPEKNDTFKLNSHDSVIVLSES